MARAVISGLSLVLALTLFAFLPGPAEAAKKGACKSIELRVSKTVVKRGGKLVLRGAACRGSRAKPRKIVLKAKARKGWRKAVTSRVRMSGRFAKRIRVTAPRGSVTTVKATGSGAESNPVRIVVRGNKPEEVRSTWGRPQVPAAEAEPEPAQASGVNCPLNTPGTELGLVAPECRVIAEDPTSSVDAGSFWGAIECQTQSQARYFSAGGDSTVNAQGRGSSGGYRRMTVFDGDDFWGQRCELGKNDHRYGPTAFYREGMRRATYISYRLPDNFPLDSQSWQTIMQMKQAQPADGGGGVPILEMQASDGLFWISSDTGDHWKFPAAKNRWIRFIFDVTYSQDPAKGSLQVSADLNGDGEIGAEERSPRIHAATLKTEIDGPNGARDGYVAGDPLASHLRAGIYHDPATSCPPPGGCSVEISNVQIMAP